MNRSNPCSCWCAQKTLKMQLHVARRGFRSREKTKDLTPRTHTSVFSPSLPHSHISTYPNPPHLESGGCLTDASHFPSHIVARGVGERWQVGVVACTQVRVHRVHSSGSYPHQYLQEHKHNPENDFLLLCFLTPLTHQVTTVADPGGAPLGPGPPCLQDFFKIMQFSGNFKRNNPYFDQILMCIMQRWRHIREQI